VISLDTEDTGVDFYHGAKPFFVTVCRGEEQTWWEWDVDPVTREPEVPEGDLREIRDTLTVVRNWGKGYDPEIADRHGIVLQNAKFDVAALTTVGVGGSEWPWEQTQDTLLASHVLASNQPHDLTALAVHYLGRDIKPFEDKLRDAVMACRRLARSKYPEWRIAKKGHQEMPSAKEGGKRKEDTPWKFDCWLPRAAVKILWKGSEAGQKWTEEVDKVKDRTREPNIFRRLLNRDRLAAECSKLDGWEYRPPETTGVQDEGHPWWTVLRDYANVDSAVTYHLWPVMVEELHRRGLWEIYLATRPRGQLAHGMERRGVTLNGCRLEELTTQYREEAGEAGEVCLNIANDLGFDLQMPKGASPNNSLREFMYSVLKVPPIYNEKAATDAPTLNKEAMEQYLTSLPEKSQALAFVRNLVYKRKRDTAVAYLEGYRRFMLPAEGVEEGWYVLHPNLNPTGTGTLRWSSSNPNEQNISKLESVCKECNGEGCATCKGTGKEFRSLRYCFGPLPGREWWSLDAKNIELRIPFYESGQEEMIALFEKPDNPPYYGSNHLLIAHILHPEKFEECRNEKGEVDGRIFKKRYAATLYQWVKNGNFAVQYGAVDRPDGTGTADRTYRIKGAQARINKRFSKLNDLNQYWIRFAEQHGYVETMPDRTVNPQKGYPLLCTRTEWGKILPTVPLNYHVQSTAMWWTLKAMIRVQAQLDQWNGIAGEERYWIALQVHDELVLDFPAKGNPVKEPESSNLWRVRKVQKLMEQGGEDFGLPTPVGVEFHPDNWSEGTSL
jgi:DNA polymerase I-like protein with 3'-5' exonuclease and polymerase domains